MRILFTGPAAAGHLFPMVPTAQALRAAGHDVLFASAQPLEQLRSAGFPIVEIGDGRGLREMFQEFLGEEMQYVSPERPQAEILANAARAFAHGSRPAVDHLLEVAASWSPDLLIHDSFHAAPPLVAAKLKIPSVVHNFGVTPGGAMVKLLAESFTDVYERHGLTGPAEATALNLGPLGGDPDGLRMRYVPYNGGGVVPAEFLHAADRPRITITLGTVLTELDGVNAVVRLVQAAAEVDADFLLAVGGADLTPLGTLPANVRALPWVPLNELLGRSDALIHHGGSGTMLTALQAGLPQLLLPQGADHFANAEALTAAGAALRSTSDTVDTATLNRLVTDPDLRAAARSVQAANTALPTPAALVPALEALTTS
ncbi:UDP:flavonoid glycosyltransferase YjiC (YdhE family) [Kitasatospora sp. MAA19]|uniref:nucleotide disphospho-sugar-binding domain-containing protein n=1 Tax=Kitasatospora sp. MAA19 TaxID=3035090 RepID=UPI0024746D06|nr:nucleotide disphospho-sugar-binding domain-containing protein [Kitasatospora sp. MAA19]MDH6703537.1 UDP:flavonoid glycosyltransferase YjiC (YdhE family) [Kitasatospora sp. MAA19]